MRSRMREIENHAQQVDGHARGAGAALHAGAAPFDGLDVGCGFAVADGGKGTADIVLSQQMGVAFAEQRPQVPLDAATVDVPGSRQPYP